MRKKLWSLAKILTFVLIFGAVLSSMVFIVGAETEMDTDIEEELIFIEYEDNLDLKTTCYNNLLGFNVKYNSVDIEFRFYDKDGNPSSVSKIINNYSENIDVISKSELEENTEETRKLIFLNYAKGVAVNQIAWIYFPMLQQDSSLADPMNDKLLEVFDRIDQFKDASSIDSLLFANGESNGICAQMYINIYSYMINLLVDDANDSDSVKIFRNNAIQSLNYISENDNNSEYQKIYDVVDKNITIQRSQDKAIAELDKVFETVFGEEVLNAFKDPEKASEDIKNTYADEMALYTEALGNIDKDDTTEISTMNGFLEQAILDLIGLLKPEDGVYVKDFYGKLYESVERKDDANNGEVQPYSDCFDNDEEGLNYHRDLHRAECKDDILNDIAASGFVDGEGEINDETIRQIEAYYNGEDGILDTKIDESEMDFAVEQAEKRVDLYVEYVAGVEAVKADKNDENADVTSITSAYENADEELVEASNSDELNAAYDDGVTALGVKVYESTHDAALNIDKDGIDVAHKALIEEAINDYNSLQDEDVKNDPSVVANAEKLLALYKEIAHMEIESALGDDGLHSEYAQKLKNEVDKLTIETAVADTAGIVAKAAPMDSVIDRYYEIAATDDHNSFTDAEKEELKKITTDACDAILDASGDYSELSSEAITELNRKEAIARIELKSKEREENSLKDVKAEIDEIKKAAAEKIGELTDADEIKNIADGAIFDIEVCFDKQDVITRTAEIVDMIGSLGYLSEEEKAELSKSAQDACDLFKNEVKDMTDEAALDEARNSVESKLDGIEEDAKDADSEAKKAQMSAAKNSIAGKHRELIDKINASSYISEDERATLISEADSIKKAAEDALASENVTCTDDIKGIEDEATVKFDGQTAEAEEKNNAAKEAQINAAKGAFEDKKAEIFEKLDGLTYLDDEEKAAIKAEIESIIESAIKGISEAESSEEIASVKNEAITKLDSEGEDAEKDNLENAKADAIEKLEAKKEEVTAALQNTTYLGDEEKQEILRQLNTQYNEAKANIDAASEIAAIETLTANTLSGFAVKQTEILEKEDDACMSLFMPIMIGLGVFGAIEAVALVLLIRKKKLGAKAINANAFVMSLTASTTAVTAWSVTAVLAAVDIALAVFIVYFAIQIIKQNKNKPVIVEAEEKNDVDFVCEEPEAQEPEPVIEVEPEIDDFESDDDDATVFSAETAEDTGPESIRIRKDKVRQAIINIDQLERYFEEGDTVDLETLKEMGLVPKRAGCIKVLARGALHKPLVVIAREFSSTAQRMIVAAGGIATVDTTEVIINK